MSDAGFCPHCGAPQGQLTLAPEPPAAKHRTSDNAAARNAAKHAYPRQGNQRWKLIAALYEHGPSNSDRLHRLTGIAYVSVSTRLTEIVNGGWAYRTGTTAPTEAGGDGEMVALTARARDRYEAEQAVAA